jgi:hypothetical protein
MSDDDDIAQPEPPRGTATKRCLRCRNDTPVTVLNHLGGRCAPCFEWFCGQAGRDDPEHGLPRRPRPAPPPPPDPGYTEPLVLPPAIPIPTRPLRGTDAEYSKMPPGELL